MRKFEIKMYTNILEGMTRRIIYIQCESKKECEAYCSAICSTYGGYYTIFEVEND